MPSLLYIGQTPAEGTGSPVVILRHLRRLAADGWQITVIAEHGQDSAACDAAGWPVHPLPARRRPWWPPYRPDSAPFLRSIRTTLIAREIRRRFFASARGPDALFGYLAAHADFAPEIAARLARQTRVPLTLLIHDDAADFARTAKERRVLRRRHAGILRAAHRNWFVSPELAAVYGPPFSLEPGAFSLPPLPEGGARQSAYRPPPADGRPRIYYGGHIWPAQYPLFARLARVIHEAGGRLVLLTRDTPELRAFRATAAPVDTLPLFPSNTEALAHLSSHASGILVSYADTLADMPWVATSFPSKFIEYAHLGLPAHIVAPPKSAIANWAARAAYPNFTTPDDLAPLARWVSDLRDPAVWPALVAPVRRHAATDFSPDKIHRQLTAALIPQSAHRLLHSP
ncbi:hypothetical protein OH491_21545 [Termitidicoccus mucosus]|uniref:glycosyltransferase n=1 Tax=Termitidicoccus mucosus TaxID=1184151 RepID=UPI003183A840